MTTIAYKRRQSEIEFYNFLLTWLIRILTFIFLSLATITILVMIDGNREIRDLEERLLNSQEEVPLIQWEPIEKEIPKAEIPILVEQVESKTEEILEKDIQVIEEQTPDIGKTVDMSETIVEPTTITELSKKVEGITPNIVTLNTSAYCSCELCCGKTDGITASGEKATPWHTVAAGKDYKIGTIIYIPALADMPNGGWFVVQDRGGAISNDKLDIYFSTHSDALQYGRKNLECYIYEF